MKRREGVGEKTLLRVSPIVRVGMGGRWRRSDSPRGDGPGIEYLCRGAWRELCRLRPSRSSRNHHHNHPPHIASTRKRPRIPSEDFPYVPRTEIFFVSARRTAFRTCTVQHVRPRYAASEGNQNLGLGSRLGFSKLALGWDVMSASPGGCPLELETVC